MAGTNISSLPAAAGVICPKDTGEMDNNASCKNCKHYPKCVAVLNGVLL